MMSDDVEVLEDAVLVEELDDDIDLASVEGRSNE